MKKRGTLSLMLAILSFAAAHCAEFQANNRTSQSQANVEVAAAPGGRFVAAWTSYFGSAGRSNDVFCRIFEPNSSPVGDEFQINQTTPGNQKEPSIAARGDGEFVVVWQGPGAAEADGEDVFARRMDPNGVPLGDEFLVNEMNTRKDQVCPKIAMNSLGSSAIVWESETDEPEPNRTAIFCRLYDPAGTPLGSEFRVNIEPDSRYPDVASDQNGNFTITWIQGRRPKFSIMARLYDSSGISISEPVKVSTEDITSFSQPAIAMNAAGCFIISWDGDPNLASLDDIHACLYEPNGAPLGSQFTVNSTLDNAQENPRAAMNDSGQFVVVWESEGDPNVNQKDILAQRFSASGERIGEELRLNSYTDSDQKYPAVAFLEDGRFVALWQSENQDSSSWGIFGETREMISVGDLNVDGYVDFPDYSIFAEEWKQTEIPLMSDLNNDMVTNALDLSVFCRNWLNSSYE